MFSFQLISVLLISVTFYTYLANIVYWFDLAFNIVDVDTVVAVCDSNVV